MRQQAANLKIYVIDWLEIHKILKKIYPGVGRRGHLAIVLPRSGFKSNSSIFLDSVLWKFSNPVCVSILPLPLTVEFLESLIWIMKGCNIRLLLPMESCMQLEESEQNVHKNELQFCNCRIISRKSWEFCKTIEKYDPALNEWKVVGEIPNNFW